MIETEEGLFVEADLDIHDSDLARQAWHSVKRNRISLSFGYIVTEDRDGADGVKELVEIDLFEMSLTPSPANADTRGALETNVMPTWSGLQVRGVGRVGDPESVRSEQPPGAHRTRTIPNCLNCQPKGDP